MTGTLEFTGGTAFRGGPIEGTVSGNEVTIRVVNFDFRADWALSGTELRGPFQYAGVAGVMSLNKRR